MSGRKVADAIRSLVNARDLQFECAKVLLKTLLVPVLMYGSETMIWKEEERSRITAVQSYNRRGLLSIMRMDIVFYEGVVRSYKSGVMGMKSHVGLRITETPNE